MMPVLRIGTRDWGVGTGDFPQNPKSKIQNWYYPLRSKAILVAVPMALLKISIKPLTLAEMPL
jgi:hypothetical protein